MSAEGKLNVNWIEPNAGAVSLNNEDTLFNIRFEVLGSLGTNTEVEIFSSPTAPVEIITDALEVAPHSLDAIPAAESGLDEKVP